MIALRFAKVDDAEFLFRLRNDAEARLNSHNPDSISWEAHLRWLNWNLRDQFVKIHIGMNGVKAVGVLRVETESTGALFSWTIAPESRGRGFGKALVAAVVGVTPGRLKAEIKVDNEPSRRIAESAGFVLEYEHNGVCNYAVTPDGYAHDPLAVLRHM